MNQDNPAHLQQIIIQIPRATSALVTDHQKVANRS